MPVLEFRQDNLNKLYFVWIGDDSQEVRIPSEADNINILKMLKQALLQAKKMPYYQQKSFKIGPNFANLLETLPEFKDPINQWVSNIGIKNPKELQTDLDILKSSKLSYLPDHHGMTYQSRDDNGHTVLHRAIFSKNLLEIERLLSEVSNQALKAYDIFNALTANIWGGKPNLDKLARIETEKSYLHHLVENLSLEEFKTIWEIHGKKLKELDSLIGYTIVDILFREQPYNDYLDFLVSQGLILKGYYSDSYTFSLDDASAKENPLKHVNRFLSILEKQANTRSTELNLPICFRSIFELKDPEILQQLLNHPYILANQAIIDKEIGRSVHLDYLLLDFSDESIWEYYLSRRIFRQNDERNELSSLISSIIRTGNLGLLLFMEKKGLYQINASTLAEATKLQVPDIITYLITERKIDPCEKTPDPSGVSYQTRPPISYIPEGADSTIVIDTYVKAMGPEAFCNMMLAGNNSPLEYLSSAYFGDALQAYQPISRENSVPALAAKIYIQENAPLFDRMSFNFGELLTDILSDEANLELLSVGYHDARCDDFKNTLDHIIQYKEELLVYGPHKQKLNKLIDQLGNPTQPKRLSKKGLEELLVITDQLQKGSMQINLAKEIGGKHFKQEEDAPLEVSLDWSTKKALIENPKNIKEINELRQKEGLSLLGEQLDISNTTVTPAIRAAWYVSQEEKKPVKIAKKPVKIVDRQIDAPVPKKREPKPTPGKVKLNYKDEGRFHFYDEVSFKGTRVNPALFLKYLGLTGDKLKATILQNFQKRINEVGNREEFLALKDELLNKDNPETKILRRAQGATFSFFACFGLQTTSMDALKDMLAQREKDFPAPEIKR